MFWLSREREQTQQQGVDMEVWRCHFRDASEEALAILSPDSHMDTMRRAARFCARWADVAMEQERERMMRDE